MSNRNRKRTLSQSVNNKTKGKSSSDNQLVKYENITHNIFVSRKKKQYKYLTEEYKYKCQCSVDKGDDCCNNNHISCLNEALGYECITETCAVEQLTGNPLKCNNRKFQRREWKNVIVKQSGKKGFGLYAAEDIVENEFVIEYVGEIINETECHFRFKHLYLNHTNSYILQLSTFNDNHIEYIDATKKGGKARFMNHSCNPNCIVQEWIIGAEKCIGLFSCKNIVKGEELVFDYKFQSYHKLKQKCHCNSINCRKYLHYNPKAPSIDINGYYKLQLKPKPDDDHDLYYSSFKDDYETPRYKNRKCLKLKIENEGNNQYFRFKCKCGSGLYSSVVKHGDDDRFCDICDQKMNLNQFYLSCIQNDFVKIQRHHGFHKQIKNLNKNIKLEKYEKNYILSIGFDICLKCIKQIIKNSKLNIRLITDEQLKRSRPQWVYNVISKLKH